jgi:hypothetical protein
MNVSSPAAAKYAIVFCSDPLEPHQPDAAFTREAAAAEQLGLAYELIDFEALVLEDDCHRAVRRIQPRGEVTEAIYSRRSFARFSWMAAPSFPPSTGMKATTAALPLLAISLPAWRQRCEAAFSRWTLPNGGTATG